MYIRQHTDAYNEMGLRQSKLWPAGTLCITIAANIAETALLGYPMCFPDSVVGFNANPDLSSEVYLHYVFTYIRETIQRATSGSIQDNINIDFLTALKFRIPCKSDQDKIVQVLSALDAKIELNNRINAELEGLAKLLYDYWFVQFDFPMTAAQATALGKPHLTGHPYRASGGKMIYNETLKREIPEGWNVCNVGDVLAKEQRTKNVLNSEIADQGRIPVIDQGSAFICGFNDDEHSVIKDTPKIVFGDHTRILKFINFPFARGADGTQILTSRESLLPQHLFYYQLLSIDLSITATRVILSS